MSVDGWKFETFTVRLERNNLNSHQVKFNLCPDTVRFLTIWTKTQFLCFCLRFEMTQSRFD